MTAKDSKVILEKLIKETECCICTETYVNPRVLRCNHTFCLICLQLNASKLDIYPGETMPCPICRKEFKIPKEGLLGLQRNFFMERLIDMTKLQDIESGEQPINICEACMESTGPEYFKFLPKAKMYCVDCKLKLCTRCSTDHSKNKISKLHNIVPFSSQVTDELQEKVIPKVCEEHRKEYLIFCNDCQEVVCPLCFIEKHSLHKGIDVRKLLYNFDKDIKDQVSSLKDFLLESEKKKEVVENVKEQSDEKILLAYNRITERAEEIKKLVDNHMKSLHEELNLLQLKNFKETTAQEEDLNEHITSLKSYLDYCSNIPSLVSSKDINETLSNVNDAVSQLKQQHEFQMSRKIQCLDVSFKVTEMDVFGKERYIIGQIEVIKTTEGKFEPLDDDDDSVRIEPSTNDKELDSFTTLPGSRKEGSGSSEIPSLKKNKQEGKEMRIEKDVELTFDESSASAEQNTGESLNSPSGSFDGYCESPGLVRTIHTKASKISHLIVMGITVLDDSLYIVHENDPFLFVYDTESLAFEELIRVDDLDYPIDLVSCQQNNCFYILDEFREECHRILRVDREGAIILKWQIGRGQSSGTLSVSYSGDIILAYKEKNVLKKYSPRGELLRTLCSSVVDGCHHAIEVSNNKVIVSYRSRNGNHVLCLIDMEYGNVLFRFREEHYTTSKVNMPLHLVEDENNVLVVDQNNRRVIICSSDLELKRELLTVKNNLRYPVKMCLDAILGRLFLVDCFYDLRTEVLRDSRILVFDIKDHNL